MTYEYRCKECGQTFDVTASVAEKVKGLNPVCPECGSKKATQVFGAIGILSSARKVCGPGKGCCS